MPDEDIGFLTDQGKLTFNVPFLEIGLQAIALTAPVCAVAIEYTVAKCRFIRFLEEFPAVVALFFVGKKGSLKLSDPRSGKQAWNPV